MHCYGIILTVGIYNIIERDDNAPRKPRATSPLLPPLRRYSDP